MSLAQACNRALFLLKMSSPCPPKKGQAQDRTPITSVILSYFSFVISFQPWKTFRNDKPSNFVVQNILQYRFDQIFDGGVDDLGGLEKLSKKNVPLEEMIKNVEEPKVSRYIILKYFFSCNQIHIIKIYSNLLLSLTLM